MELAGKVIAVLEPKSGVAKTSGNPWMVQEYVIETHDQFPRRMCFEVFGEDKIRQFNIQLGEELNVFFDINAREWQGRYFNGIRAWRVERIDPNAPTNPIPQAGNITDGTVPPFDNPPLPTQPPFEAQAPQAPQPQQPVQPQDFKPADADEELPF